MFTFQQHVTTTLVVTQSRRLCFDKDFITATAFNVSEHLKQC